MKIPLASPALDGHEQVYLNQCLLDGWVSGKGSFVPRFEAAVAARSGVRYGIAVSSGTNALHLALLALGVGPGDEVLLPALSYVATANAVAYTGAQVVFVDVDPATWNLDLDQLTARITPRTRAIIVVHLYGHPVDMAPVQAVGQARDIAVVEDACQAIGASYRGRPVGGLGQIGCFSFYGNKIITTGEGGMVVTDVPELAASVRSLSDQAATEKPYWHTAVGFNYRMTNLQAALGLAQMERLDEFLAARREIARLYDRNLANIPGMKLYEEPDWATGICWLYSLLVDNDFRLSRDELIDHLAANGVETKPFFSSLPTLPPHTDGGAYPAAACLAAQGLSLPTYTKLQPAQVTYIARVIRDAA